MDLSSVLRAATCYPVLGERIYNEQGGSGCEYVYGRTLLNFLNLVHLRGSATFISGTLLMITFLALLIHFSFFYLPTKPVTSLVSVFALCSPPVILLLERGNIDIVIFLLLFAAFHLFASGKGLFSFLLILLASLFKFYTLPILLILIFKTTNKWLCLIKVVATLIAGYIVLKDVTLINQGHGVPEPTQLAFGAPLFGLELNHWAHATLTWNESLFLGWVIQIGIALLVINRKLLINLSYSDFMNEIGRQRSLNHLLLFFNTVYLTSWALGMNYDYRLVYLIPLIIILSGRTRTMYSAMTLLSAIVVIYCSFEILRAQFVGDFVILALNALLIPVISGQIYPDLKKIIRKIPNIC